MHKYTFKYLLSGYSKESDGVFCLPCMLWTTASNTGTDTSYLVDKPFTDWKRIRQKMSKHMSTTQHEFSAQKMDNFKQIQAGTAQIPSALESQTAVHAKRVQSNRTLLSELFSCMRLCVERGFARRGSNDAGLPVLSTETSDCEDSTSETDVNLGNFKAIVAFRAEGGSEVLKEHLKSSAKNATYMSSRAQIDMLGCILRQVQSSIVSEAKNQRGKFIFAVSADEVTDVSTTEQLGIVLRTVSPDGSIKERLLEYIDMVSITGESIKDAVLGCLTRHGIDIRDCRAQTYDGAGNMCGEYSGCQAHIKRIQPLAEYHHCSSHKLNLALNITSNIQEFRLLVENIKALGIFFKYSPQRVHAFDSVLPEHVKKRKIHMMSETRWVERHTVMADIKELYPYIVQTLTEISSPDSRYNVKTVRDGAGLLATFTSHSMIAALVIADKMMGYTRTLSQRLQGSTKDVEDAHRNIDDVLEAIKSTRGEEMFSQLWIEMVRLNNNQPLQKPRTAARQTLRANVEASTSEEYYR